MAARKVRSFSELYGSNAYHEGAKSLRELVDAEFTCIEAEFGRSQYGKVSYLLVGETAETAQWYFTTSKVILGQLSEIMEKNPFPFHATLREKNGYLILE